MAPLRLYNTLTRKKELFHPANGKTVSLYTCGPTVYNFAHIGNLRTYIFEDVLKRVLQFNGFRVNHVMNITDVGHLTDDQDAGEDRMELGAQREKISVWELAEHYTTAFQKDLASLNILLPNTWCKATEHIPEQIALIQKLERNGLTYELSDGIYFDTSRFPSYGALARIDTKGLKPGARVEIVEGKRNPSDFALWKYSYPHGRSFDQAQDDAARRRQMEWPSPWGVGFPGWHIECSAMSMHYLKIPIDIHCGGIDHIPVHHTNEIAQSEAASGKQPFVRFWMHGAFLTIRSDRMGKSKGNFLTLSSLQEEGYEPLAYRLLTYSGHYRTTMDFTFQALDAAQQSYDHLRNSIRERLASRTQQNKSRVVPKKVTVLQDRFTAAVNDDLNIPEAMAILWETLRSDVPVQHLRRLLQHFDTVLGLDLLGAHEELIPEDIQELITQRDAARKQKNWNRSDELRKHIEGLGYTVEDTASGTRVTRCR